MSANKAKTFGELKKQVTRLPDVREEMRNNLIRKLGSGETLFPGLIGYEETVMPGLINAILCGHNIIFLGERGQGKSRIIRSMVDFLDEEIPAITDCPINDNPFDPICIDCRVKAAEMSDDLPISYISRDVRLVEKLATSDVSTADLIGEVDPIKIAQGRTLDDESAIHYGLVPRANRGIFAVNELPDLAEKIQVAFFNIMEENDFQIKGFPVRLPLDILVIATANPEDYTSRGRIITPLKDRFDIQLKTHYPLIRKHEIEIMEQEADIFDLGDIEIYVPQYIKEIIAEMTFQSRNSPEINQHSGVSCRISIRSYETIIGNAVRRCLALDEKRAVPRITDVRSTYPAILGKLELEYEVADEKGEELLEDIARRSIKMVFDEHFNIDDLSQVVESFNNGRSVEVSQAIPSEVYLENIKSIPEIKKPLQTIVDDIKNSSDVSSAVEFILEGLHLSNRLNREEKETGVVYG